MACRGKARVIRGVSVDSRTLQTGDLFFALKGVRHDGHDHISQALQKGACGVVGAAGRLGAVAPGAAWAIEVADPLAALGGAAQFWRDRCGLPVIGVTGSNGKTTCKEMVAAVLAVRFSVHKTEGNLNNQVGVPLTLFGLKTAHRIAVVEMGMNHTGEIAALARIARPSAAVITNVGRAHLEGFAAPDQVAQAKGELLEGTASGGPVFLNADDAATPFLIRKARGPVTRFGFGPGADIRGEEISGESVDGCRVLGHARGRPFELKLPMAGRHNVLNALAALAVGEAFGVPVAEGAAALAKFRGAPLRSEIVRLAGDRILYADCYNANPDSMAAALAVVRQIASERPIVAVLGDMLEMGKAAGDLHRELGRQAALHGVQTLVAVGCWAEAVRDAFRAAAGGEAHAFPDAGTAVRQVMGQIGPSQFILVKGSRGVGLEAVVAALKGRYSS